MRHVIEEMTSIKEFKGNWLSGLCVINLEAWLHWKRSKWKKLLGA